MPSGVIFDLDGTLLDSIGDLVDAANIVLKTHGYPIHTIPAFKEMVGDGIHVLVQRMLPEEHRSLEEINKIVLEMGSLYEKISRNKTVPFKGVPEVLDALKVLDMPMAILSNKPQIFMIEMVNELLPRWHFEPVWGVQDGRPKKPDPGAALAIAEGWGKQPSDCLFVGDSEPDIRTAKNAGMISVAVTWGFRSIERLAKESPDYLIHKPMDLLDLFR
ncbi:MAG: HAD family hydrolase [bacterium]